MAKTKSVAMMPASMRSAVCGSRFMKLWMSAGMAPVAMVGFVGEGSGESARVKSDCETPAAMNKLIPEPMPHLVQSWSMNMMIMPPRMSWKMRMSCRLKYVFVPWSRGDGASPPMKT